MMVKCSSLMVKWLFDNTLISPSLKVNHHSLVWPSLRSCTDCTCFKPTCLIKLLIFFFHGAPALYYCSISGKYVFPIKPLYFKTAWNTEKRKTNFSKFSLLFIEWLRLQAAPCGYGSQALLISIRIMLQFEAYPRILDLFTWGRRRKDKNRISLYCWSFSAKTTTF